MGCKLSGVMPLETILDRNTDLLVLRGHDDEKPGDPDASEDKGEDDEKSDESNGEGKDDDKGDKGEKPEELKRRLANAEEALDRNVKKRKEAEQKVTELQNKIKNLEKDGMSDAEAAQKIKDGETTIASLQETNRKLALENAFLKDNTHQWQSPARALQLADLKEVEIDDDGSVHGLRKALDALAKSDPYLLKPKADDDNAGGDDSRQQQRQQGTGRRPGSGKQTEAAEAARQQALRQKYPGLRR
jgi:hypothetical protein